MSEKWRGIKCRLITRIKVDPKNPRSRLVFRPTAKGLAVAVLYLGTSYERHKSQYEKEVISQYELVIPGVYGAPIAFRCIANLLLHYNYFDKFGNLLQINSQQRKGVLDALQRYILAENLLSGNIADIFALDKDKMKEVAAIVKAGKNVEQIFQIFKDMGIKV